MTRTSGFPVICGICRDLEAEEGVAGVFGVLEGVFLLFPGCG